MRCLSIGLIALSLIGCGGNNGGPTVGGNNGNNGDNNGVIDQGMPPNNGLPDVSNMPDPDTGRADQGGTPDMDRFEDMDGTPDSGADMAPDTGDACPPRAGVTGDPCDCDMQCASGACVGEGPSAPGFCSVTCTSRQDCSGGAGTCVTEPGTGLSYCHPDDTGTPCTTNTVADPSLCGQDLCVRAGSNHTPRHFCSVECETAGDCKAQHACAPMRCQAEVSGWSCIPTIVAHRAGAQKGQVLLDYPLERNLCVKIGDPNPCSNATDQLACASGICDAVTTGGSRCTAECADTLDCPAGGCADRDVSDPALPIRHCDLP